MTNSRLDACDLAVVAIVRNEAAYLEEWIAFHQVVGVQRFFVYDNDSTDATRSILEAHDDVVSVYWPGPRQQLKAYAHALSEFGPLARWMAFIDADEFLFSPTFKPLPTLLHDLDAPAVGVCWAMYGTSGLESPPSRVISSFRHRARLSDPAHRHVKSIVRPEFVAGVGVDPHHFRVLTVDEHGRQFRGPFVSNPSWDRLRINHYWSKSLAEARHKATVPRADNAECRSFDQLVREELNAVDDPILSAYAPLVEARLGQVTGGVPCG